MNKSVENNGINKRQQWDPSSIILLLITDNLKIGGGMGGGGRGWLADGLGIVWEGNCTKQLKTTLRPLLDLTTNNFKILKQH